MKLSTAAPNLYFRLREPGAAVFRVLTENPQKRLELDLIAIANSRNGEIKPQGPGPSEAEREEITDWIETRRKGRHRRDDAAMQALGEQLNEAAQWLQARADKRAVTANAGDLLFALHDLRSALVRRLAEINDKEESEE